MFFRILQRFTCPGSSNVSFSRGSFANDHERRRVKRERVREEGTKEREETRSEPKRDQRTTSLEESYNSEETWTRSLSIDRLPCSLFPRSLYNYPCILLFLLNSPPIASKPSERFSRTGRDIRDDTISTLPLKRA